MKIVDVLKVHIGQDDPQLIATSITTRTVVQQEGAAMQATTSFSSDNLSLTNGVSHTLINDVGDFCFLCSGFKLHGKHSWMVSGSPTIRLIGWKETAAPMSNTSRNFFPQWPGIPRTTLVHESWRTIANCNGDLWLQYIQLVRSLMRVPLLNCFLK